MTSIIKLQVISGAEDESPHCYLLQVDEFRFLLDCGWDENFNMNNIRELKKHINQLDAVLLSYPDPLHLGALPYLIGKCNLSCPIYATVPIYKMGQMFMYDLYQSRHNSEDFQLFTLDDVDAAFDKMIQLKYNQSVALTGKGQGLTITPLPAGHMIGGAVWKIAKDGEEEIVYAVDFNHKKERHLNGCALDTVCRPAVLITDAFNATYTQVRRRDRDEQLMTKILQTLRGSGNVLICVDTAGRVLELTHMLDQLWRNQDSGLMAYSLALLNNVSFNVVEFAKSQVEWMSDKIMRTFEGARNNPFHFRHIHMCHSLGELARVPEPKVVLASQPDLECGFSRDLFIAWCTNPKNRIVLTCRTSPGTLARKLIDNPDLRQIQLEIRQRVRLEGAELDEYLRREAASKAAAASSQKEESDSDDSDDDVKMEIGTRHDILIKSENKAKAGFFKQTKKSYPTFPYREEKIKWDEYGEQMKPEELMNFEISFPAGTGGQGEDEKPVIINNVSQDVAEPTLQEDDPAAAEVPTKCVSSFRTLDLRAAIHFIDFEGRSDSESIRKLLALTQPRRLILVRGPPTALHSLTQYCQSQEMCDKIYSPRRYEIVDATTESHIYQIKLKDSLVSSLKFAKAKDAELAWVDAEIVQQKKPMEVSEDGVDQEEREEEEMLTLQPLPPGQAPTHSTIFVNEVKLSDLRQVLMKNGISAEFSGGALVCNNQVAVRRNEAGRIQLEGCLSEDFLKVRELLYEQYAII